MFDSYLTVCTFISISSILMLLNLQCHFETKPSYEHEIGNLIGTYV